MLREMLLYALLFVGTYAWSMKNNRVVTLTRAQADKIKKEVKCHIKRENDTFYTIPQDVMEFIIKNKRVYSAFLAQKDFILLSKTSELDGEQFDTIVEQFNTIVDSYVKEIVMEKETNKAEGSNH